MGRFAKNQWLAFILTLSVLLASSASFTSSYAGNPKPIQIGEGAGGGASGDPDAPGGPDKSSPSGPHKYSLSPGGTDGAATPVGDGGAVVRVWGWRFHVVLRSLTSRWLRL